MTHWRVRLKRIVFALAPLLAVATLLATSASDSFNRANSGTLGGNWTELPGYTSGFQIVSNKAEPVGSGTPQIAYYSGVSVTGNQFSEAVTADDPYYMGLVVRASGSAPTQHAYVLVVGRGGSADTTLVVATNSGLSSVLTTFSASTASAGDTIRLEAQDSGGNVLLRAYLNGVQLGSTYTDSTYVYTGGAPGIFGNFAGFDDFDSWNGGDLGGGASQTGTKSLLGSGK